VVVVVAVVVAAVPLAACPLSRLLFTWTSCAMKLGCTPHSTTISTSILVNRRSSITFLSDQLDMLVILDMVDMLCITTLRAMV
jgi:hypothetical protein